MKKQFMPLALVSLLVCSLLCTSAFAANRDTQTEPAVIEVDTAALFSTIESNEAQMVKVLEKQAGAVVVAPEFSHFSDVATSNALQAGGDVEQTDYVPGTESHEDGIDPESSGELAAGKSWSYDAQSMSKGQKITISVDYTPHLVQYADWFEGLQWYGLLYHGYWRFRFCNLQHQQNWHLFHLCGESRFCQR